MPQDEIEQTYREGCRIFYHQTGPGSDKSSAADIFLQILEKDPCHHQSYNMLGMCYASDQRNREAEDMFRKAIAIDTRSVYLLNLGILMARENRLEESAEAMSRSVELDPGDPSALFNLGYVRYLSEDLDRAISLWEKTRELAPAYEDLHTNLGTALTEKGRSDEALEVLRDGVAKFPNRTELYVLVSVLLEDTGRYGEAVSLWEGFLEKNHQKDEEILAEVRGHLEKLRESADREEPQ